MSAEQLITKHLDIWTSAHKTRSSAGRGSSSKLDLYGIKKLRELILELAVRGKLVPQDPNDEPAVILLSKVKIEKKRLEKEGKLKTSANELIDKGEHYIDLPNGWEFARLGNLAKFIDYRGKTPTKVTEGIPLITAKNVRFGYIDREPREYITESEYQDWMTRGYPKLNDLLITTEAPLGNVAVIDIDEKFALAQRVICFQLHEPKLAKFLRIAIMSKVFQEQLNANANGMTATGVKSSKLKEIPIVIPPLAEQERIVAKVDELMAFCDELEQAQTDNISAHAQLVEALLTTLTNSKDHEVLQANWQRIAEHFNTLFTSEDSIDQLIKTILVLATEGKIISFSENSVVGKLSDFLSFGPRNGLSPVESSTEKSCKVLKLGATSFGFLDLSQTKYVDINIPTDSHLWLKSGDILIQRGNSQIFVGSNILIREDIENVIYPDLMMKLRVSEKALPEYVSLWLSSPTSREYMWHRMTGTSGTMPKISKGVVEGLPIVVPTLEVQLQIVTLVDELMSICDSIKIELKNLQTKQLDIAETLVAQTV